MRRCCAQCARARFTGLLAPLHAENSLPGAVRRPDATPDPRCSARRRGSQLARRRAQRKPPSTPRAPGDAPARGHRLSGAGTAQPCDRELLGVSCPPRTGRGICTRRCRARNDAHGGDLRCRNGAAQRNRAGRVRGSELAPPRLEGIFRLNFSSMVQVGIGGGVVNRAGQEHQSSGRRRP